MVIPIIDLPFIGLSLSAPIFFFIAFYAIFKSPSSWFHTHSLWITLAIIIWLGTFVSAVSNGILSGGVNINIEGYKSILRVAYWLLLFVVTIYFAGQYKVATRVSSILGIIVFVLGTIRWFEIFIFGNFSTSNSAYMMTQNTYGLLFSTFSPFLLVFILSLKGMHRLWAGIGLLILWGAVVINGSRGSWVAISVGLLITLLILFLTRKQKFFGLFIGLTIIFGLVAILILGVPQVSETVLNRFDSFNKLDQDKSYAIRLLMNQKAIRLFEESPIIGIGPARFRLTSTPLEIPTVLSYAPQSHFDAKSAHNSYLAYVAETGLIGGIPLSILLLVLLIRGFHSTKQLSRKNQYWALAIYLSFVQMSIHLWVINSLTNSATWFIYGLNGAMIMIGKNIQNSSENKN